MRRLQSDGHYVTVDLELYFSLYVQCYRFVAFVSAFGAVPIYSLYSSSCCQETQFEQQQKCLMTTMNIWSLLQKHYQRLPRVLTCWCDTLCDDDVQVDPVDVSHEVAKLQDAAQSYTKADGEVVKLMLQKPALLLPKKCYMISGLIKVIG